MLVGKLGGEPKEGLFSLPNKRQEKHSDGLLMYFKA